jgi:gamma-glutamylaminecyclotransferase
MLLFVYGTLQSFGANNAQMSGCTLLRSAVTDPCYTLLHFGLYPGLVNTGSTAVHGELWEVPPSEIRRLDRFEGVEQGVFTRAAVRVRGEAAAYAYFINDSHAILGAEILTGAWVESP